MTKDNNQAIAIVPRSAKERRELIAREKKKMQLSYQKMCVVKYLPNKELSND